MTLWNVTRSDRPPFQGSSSGSRDQIRSLPVAMVLVLLYYILYYYYSKKKARETEKNASFPVTLAIALTSSSIYGFRLPLLYLQTLLTHVQPEVAQYPPYWGLFTEKNVIKRHVTPKRFPWKGEVSTCATGSRRFLLQLCEFECWWRGQNKLQCYLVMDLIKHF
jgi:heme/copper-type cytochrome/quinol oxidase subunit 2